MARKPRKCKTEDEVEPRIPLGRWLVENMPRIGDLELPDRAEPEPPPPFSDWEFEDDAVGK
jgi:hypothetical protein